MSVATSLAIVLLAQTSGIGGVSLADIPAYAAALKNANRERPTPVTFRELWSKPDSYRGRIVEISGRVARIFRAPAQGELPPRVEVWIDQDGNLICVVVPDRVPADEHLQPGRFVAISGTFLGTVRYSGGDVERLAPWIVGSGSARSVRQATSAQDPTTWPASAWIWVAIGSLAVGGFLAWAHSRRPGGPRPDTQDDVEFLS